MHTNFPKYRRYRVLAMGIFAAMGLAGPTAGFAQGEEEKLEEVIVTGSRIARKDLESSIPISVVNEAEIELQSVQVVSELVKDLPEVAGNLTTLAISNGGGEGTSDITLRGLPSSETLILLDGKRIVGESAFGSNTVDINAIPIGMIERVEVLKDGASAIYGSDAIAGVVNVITKKDFDGIEIEGYYGQADAGQGTFPNMAANTTWGKNFDEGNITIGFDWFKQDEVMSRDRSVSDAATFAPSSATPWGRWVDAGNATVGAGSAVQFPTAADFGGFNFFPLRVIPVPADPSGDSDIVVFYPSGSTGDVLSDLYNYSEHTTAILELERRSFWGNAHWDLTDELRIFLNANFTETESAWQLAPVPMFTAFETPSLTIAANQQFNPFGIPIIDGRRRFVELGPRNVYNEHDKKQIMGGLEGSFQGWDWGFAANWGRSDSLNESKALLHKSRLQLALGDPAACTALAAQGCVQANVFGSGLAGAVTGSMQDWISTSATTDGFQELIALTFDVARENIWELPAGPVGVAAGVEYREEEVFIDRDDQLNTFQTIGSVNQLDTQGDRNVTEIYGEVVIPVHEMIEIDAAFRYSDYSDFGDTVNPKISGVIRPEQYIPGFRVRGAWGEGFRAANMIELFSGGSENFGTFRDPCAAPTGVPGGTVAPPAGLPGCGAFASDPTLIQFLSLEGGNPELAPEESETWTIGFVYSPEWFKGLNMSLDYYNIEVENAILINSQFIIDLAAQGVPEFQALVTRDANGNISIIRGGYLNLAFRSTEGIDYMIDYSFPEYDWGQVNLAFRGNHVIEFLDAPDASVDPIDIVGDFIDAAADGLGSIPEHKWNFNANWTRGPWMLNGRLNYVAGLDEHYFLGGVVVNEMSSWLTFDLQGSYEAALWKSQTRITVGVDNVLDEEPPTAVTGFNDSMDGRTHNLIGRFLYTRLTVNF